MNMSGSNWTISPSFQKYCLIMGKSSSVLLEKNDPTISQLLNDADVFYEINYESLTTAITQMIYDYQYLLGQFLKTDPKDKVLYELSLDRLMNLFSKSLTQYHVKNFANFTSWQSVRDFYDLTGRTYFQGYTSHNSLNVRVRPILNNKNAQAYAELHLLEFSRVNLSLISTQKVIDAGNQEKNNISDLQNSIPGLNNPDKIIDSDLTAGKSEISLKLPKGAAGCKATLRLNESAGESEISLKLPLETAGFKEILNSQSAVEKNDETNKYIQGVGQYAFKLAYEEGQWRFVTWSTVTYHSSIIPQIYFTEPLYQLSPSDP